jgi:hypothetical protein
MLREPTSHRSVRDTTMRLPRPPVHTGEGLRRSRRAGRLVVLSGHYDSRATDPMDATSDAPGANDDASGTADPQ